MAATYPPGPAPMTTISKLVSATFASGNLLMHREMRRVGESPLGRRDRPGENAPKYRPPPAAATPPPPPGGRQRHPPRARHDPCSSPPLIATRERETDVGRDGRRAPPRQARGA